MKVAVIGCGTIANAQHIPAYMKNEEAEIKYFCDIIPERAEEAVKKYGCGKAVTDYREVLDDDVAVANNLPTVFVGPLPGSDFLAGVECERRTAFYVGVEVVGATFEVLECVHITNDIFIAPALDVAKTVVDDGGELLVGCRDDFALRLDVQIVAAPREPTYQDGRRKRIFRKSRIHNHIYT